MSDILVFDHPLSLGLKTRLVRISRLLSQEELATLANVPQESVSRLERNLPIGHEAKQRILKILGLDGEISHA